MARSYDPNLGRFLSVDPVLDVQAALKEPAALESVQLRVEQSDQSHRSRRSPGSSRDRGGDEEQAEYWAGYRQGLTTIAEVGTAIGSLFTPGPDEILVGGILGKFGSRVIGRLFGRSDEVAGLGSKASR